MAARYDKYDPVSGGFRAPLAAAITSGDVGKIFAVALNSSGQVIRTGIATNPVVGVICPHKTFAAGDIIDVMTSGEIVGAEATSGAALNAGAAVYGHADGTINNTATSGKLVGVTVEADRLVVRIGAPSPVA